MRPQNDNFIGPSLAATIHDEVAGRLSVDVVALTLDVIAESLKFPFNVSCRGLHSPRHPQMPRPDQSRQAIDVGMEFLGQAFDVIVTCEH